MTLNDQRILVAGGTGMVGAAVARELLDRFPQARIVATRYSQTNDPIQSPRVEWVQADLRNAADARRAAIGCDAAVMCAATTAGVRGMASEPWRSVNDNVIMNTQMLEAFHHEGVKRVVFISSATVYQDFEGAIGEHELNLNQDPAPAYAGVGWGMRFIEKLCQFWHDKTGMVIPIVRAANVFGPYAIFHPERSNVIPALIRKAVSGTSPFEVWGSPDVVRDVIYSGDFAQVIVSLLAAEHIQSEVFNVGSGVGTSVAEMVRLVLEAADHQPSEIKWVNRTETTVKKRLLDCSKITQSVNWSPGNRIAEGIRATTHWWKENQDSWKR